MGTEVRSMNTGAVLEAWIFGKDSKMSAMEVGKGLGVVPGSSSGASCSSFSHLEYIQSGALSSVTDLPNLSYH